MKRGKFITFEGVDGAGKSTHIPALAETLRNRGIDVVLTREPGGTVLGEKLRDLLLHEAMHPETEAILMFAARREHIAQVIQPALDRGAYVLSDRFTDASFAYQHGGRGVSEAKLQQLELLVQGDLQPDLTLLFDLPVEVSLQRLANARDPDKFERENAEFFQKIRDAYLSRAKQFPKRIQVVDAHQSLASIADFLQNLFKHL